MELSSSEKFSLVAVVYLAFLLDNVLLTVVVPIIPDFLYSIDSVGGHVLLPSDAENSKVALLLSSKALVQLFANPALGFLITRIGYQLPLLLGTIMLFLVSLVFAVADDYFWLFTARSLHGLASASIAVAGMCGIAESFSEEKERSKMMGLVLGSMALGVLLGYPLGAVLYDLLSRKSAPFLLVAFLSVVCIICQCRRLDLSVDSLKLACSELCLQIRTGYDDDEDENESGIMQMLSQKCILLSAGSILISTSAMAVLEPCLPLWLMETIKPKKWQLGTVFIPDSLGYLIGTNFFGSLAYKFGYGFLALAAMFLVGVCAFLVSFAKTVLELTIPHFGLGLGIGVVDATMVPLMAQFVDLSTSSKAQYGPVYALQQGAVCLAYFFGPIVGSLGVNSVGFPVLMGLIGTANLCYCVFLPQLGMSESTAKYQRQVLN
ncbi:synaptic vesicular amine transporter-like [Neocloeon triangulifer]|uniref:synaptic vesicular amine transporter-like n=1 Tax=Neocloeon triangulifer TaxID=2078957 RepID=UPI00286FA4F5|nr:synaptic vesicular amine transporter-like [Neocloeon triangulifer]